MAPVGCRTSISGGPNDLFSLSLPRGTFLLLGMLACLVGAFHGVSVGAYGDAAKALLMAGVGGFLLHLRLRSARG
jgi:hypothetical protein